MTKLDERSDKTLVTAWRRYLFDVTALVSLIAAAVLVSLVMFLDVPREVTGILVILLMLTLLVLGLPIGIGMTLASLIGLWKLLPFTGFTSTMQVLPFNATASWSLSVIPLFILMGIVLYRSGISGRAFKAAAHWMGPLPGGLAMATNFAGAGLASASGSSLGITYAMGRIAIPDMLRAGYAPSLATGTVAAAGSLGQLIPPSILLVVYAGVAGTSVGPQLLAGFIPGIILAAAFAAMILIRSILQPGLAPRFALTGSTWRTRMGSLVGVIPLAIIVIVVLGGLAGGIFTATEAGAWGALSAIIMGWIWGTKEHRSLRGFLKFLKPSLYDAAASTASVFLLLIGVLLLTRVLTLSRVTTGFAEWVVAQDYTQLQFLLLLVVVYLILGMFLDPMAMILLTVPVLLEPLAVLNIDLLWFGIFLVIMCEVAQMSPPVGILSFVVHGIVQKPEVNLGKAISLAEVFRGVSWFVAVALGMVLALIAFPEIATWLPERSAAK